jgi:hypothetical protein
VELGLLRIVNTGRQDKASRWTLFPNKRVLSNTSMSLRPGYSNEGCGYDVLSAIHFDHESFRYSFLGKKGLGTSGAIVLDCLYRGKGLRIAQICALTGFSRSTVDRALRRLRAAEVAICEARLWSTPPVNLDEKLNAYAQRVGLERSSDIQKDRHGLERDGYRSLYSDRYN